MLTEPAPPANEPYATGIWHYARALAYVARGQDARADAEAAALSAAIKHPAFQDALKGSPLSTNLQIASRIVKGEIAARAGRSDEAIAALREAAAIEDGIPYNEPPVWHHPPRQILGAVLLDAGKASDAEKVYLEDLRRFPENGWSLFGLSQSLEAQGRGDEARAVRARFEKAWARADITLSSSRVLSGVEPAIKTTSTKEAPVRSVVLADRGVTLQYVEQGDPSGVPVILLHGVTDSWRSFEPLLPHLPSSFRAFAISQRGHGDSSRPAEGYRYVDFSEDVRAFMDVLRLPAAVVVGHSMGGLVAERFAIDHPERTLGLVIMGSFKTIRGNHDVRELWSSTISRMDGSVSPAFVRGFQESTLARPVPPDYFETVVAESLKVPARVWRATFAEFLLQDHSDALGRVTAPTLVLWGEKDAFSGRAEQDALVASIPGARLVTYAAGGHALHWEDPKVIAEELSRFAHATALAQPAL
jgi:pimeloyl-ACP methyl ester carboxylesterase